MPRYAAFILLVALCLAGCTTTQQKSSPDFAMPQSGYKLVIMRPDVAVSTLTIHGKLEPRADWSSTAHDHIQQFLRDFAQSRGSDTRLVVAPADAGLDESALLELERLHGAVGASILEFKFSEFVRLPTKRRSFDWTLGELATGFGAKSGSDYALFVHARDSFSSTGRSSLQVALFVGCMLSTYGCLYAPEGGTQMAFASLVDLRTGNVVWFNALHSPVGDIRTPEGADTMMKKLLDPLTGKKGRTP